LNIRCERCSTTYELDETLLAPEGSPVQCTKCQHVFTAVPPRTAGRTLVGVPAAPAPHPVAPPRPPAPEQVPVGTRQGPAIYRPNPSSNAPASASSKGQKPRRDTMGAFEARLKAGRRLRWMIPLAVAAVALLALLAWGIFAPRVDASAARRHGELMALVALDDIESLEGATRGLDELSRGQTGIETLAADRALAQLLLSTGMLEEISSQAAQLAARTADRERAVAAQPPSAPELLATLAAEVEALRSQVEPRQNAARTLTERAYGALKTEAAARGGDVAVVRALCVHFAAAGDREQALRFVRSAGAAAERDPWIQLAEGWVDAREEGREARERGVAKLAALAASHPEIVRARFLLARAQAALGKREAAAATLDALLAANPRHRRAARLRSELVGGAQARPAGLPAPGAPVGVPGGAPAARPIMPSPAPAPAPAVAPAPARAPVPVIPAQSPPAAQPAAQPSAAPAVRPVAPAPPHVPPVPSPAPAVVPATPAAAAPARPQPVAPAAPAPAPARPQTVAPAAPAPVPARPQPVAPAVAAPAPARPQPVAPAQPVPSAVLPTTPKGAPATPAAPKVVPATPAAP
jgi:predicted Zn finger-like uncharacterized protein